MEREGEEHATNTGVWLRDLFNNLIVKPDEIEFVTSSLERCISTAKLVMQGMGHKNTPLGVYDGLREWVGYGHQSNTDKRITKTQIEKRHKGTVNLKLEEGFPEIDNLFVKDTDGQVKELWDNVGQRWVKALASAFETPQTKYVIVVSNNRAIQCGLRELGLRVNTGKMATNESFPEKLVVEDMKNAGAMALVLDKSALTKEEIDYRKRITKDDERNIKNLVVKEDTKAMEQAEKQPDTNLDLLEQKAQIPPEKWAILLKSVGQYRFKNNLESWKRD